jgi:hypothetical protein
MNEDLDIIAISRRAGEQLDALLGAKQGPIDASRVTDVIAAFDAVPPSASYHFVPPSVRNLLTSGDAQGSGNAVDLLRRATLLQLIRDFQARASGRNYTPRVMECFARGFSRVLRLTAKADPVHYRGAGDKYLKDLAICRQHSFPAGGGRIIEAQSGVQRSLAWADGAAQALGMAKLALFHGGTRPYYRCHTHLLELDEFTPEGWHEMLLRVAEMLCLHPEIRGLCGGSWLYDPALQTVSPELAYIRQVPQDNGAFVFYQEVSIDGGALAKSAKRRALYDEGRYVPKSYSLVWPRASLIAWAGRDRTRRSTESSTLPSRVS